MNYWQILDLWFKVKLYDLKSTVLFDLEACLHFCSVLDVCACVCVCVGGWVDGGGEGEARSTTANMLFRLLEAHSLSETPASF